MARLVITFIALAIIGAAVSYLGNQLGRHIGRRKMSIFNLRPRHTSILITSITGSLIAVMTLTFAYVSSWEVRTLFKGLEKFRQTIAETTAKTMEQKQMGGVLYRPGEPFFATVIDGDKPPEAIESQLMAVIAAANDSALQRSREVAEIMGMEFKMPTDGRVLGYHKNEIENLVPTIQKIRGRVIVEPISDNYAFLGEKFSVSLKIFEYIPKVFDEDDVIISGIIDGRQGEVEIAKNLSKLLVEAKIIAIRKGMLENPITYELVTIDRTKLKGTIEKIVTSKKLCVVNVKATKATDNKTPLDVYLEIGQ